MNTRDAPRPVLLFGLLALSIGFGVLILPSEGPARPAEAFGPSTAHTFFLPFLAKSLPGISGGVTFNGVPAPAVGLNLEFYNGISTTPIMTTSTAGDGGYQFQGAPSLAAHQHYDVQFTRPTVITGTIRSWATNSITTYIAGGWVAMPIFDVADVPLVQPTANTTATLPVTFQWTPRPATPLDNYTLEMRNSALATTWSSGLLGYVGSFTLTALPPGFSLGVKYPWYIRVQSPDGGVGFTSSQDVTFQ